MADEEAAREIGCLPKFAVLFLSETLGTFILVFIGCMGVSIEIIEAPVLPHFPGFAFGLAAMVAVQTCFHISGSHINPQITLAVLILGRMKLVHVPVYLLGQFIGALIGFGFIRLLTPDQYAKNLCLSAIHRNLNLAQGVGVEAVLTFFLVLVLGAVLDPRNAKNTDSIPIRFGLTISVLAIVGGPYSSCSMNTARSFAPALINWNWTDQWIFWVGPTIGSALAATLYRFAYRPLPKE